MDPATLRMVLQIGQALARSRMVRGVVAGCITLAVCLAAATAATPLIAVNAAATAQHYRAQLGDTTLTGSTAQDCGVTVEPAQPAGVYTAEQVGIARAAAQVADQRHLPDRAKLVILVTGFQESGIRNLTYGDRDSIGWLQQRPSAGWGTVAQIMDPAYGAGKFYDALVEVSGWETLPVTVAAQRVQISAYPYAYAKWEKPAQALLTELGDSVATEDCADDEPVISGPQVPAVGAGREAARRACLKLGSNSVFTYSGHQPTMNKAWDCMATGATGQRIADHLATNRKAYGISYIIWNREILRDYDKPGIPAGTWADYFDGGSTDPSRAHTNHVHTSYY